MQPSGAARLFQDEILQAAAEQPTTATALVFKGLVAWTEKMTATKPNPTDCNQTVGCGCLVWGSVGLPVALIQKYLKTIQKPVAISCNWSSYSV
jgi:hypothetical protein